MKRTTLTVTNMSCSGCANSIKKNLARILGIEVVNVDYEKGQIDIRFEDFSDLNVAKCMLDDLGYPDNKNVSLYHKGRSKISCIMGRIS